MKKILHVVPAPNTAITIQSKGIQKHNDKYQFKMVTFHPKKPSKTELQQIRDGLAWADLVDMQYWKSGAKIKELYPAQFERVKKILTHYNPYNLHEDSWDDYEKVIVVNNYQKSELPNATLIPLSIDLDFFKYSRYYTPEKVVHMAVNRIEGKKGVREVAQACNELGFKFILVGRVSNPQYMNQVRKAGGKQLDFREGVSDNKLRESYYESAIHVCNSVPNFESGTLPVLEAMACGIPVLSRRVGHVPDLYDGENMRINEASEEDVESLVFHLKEMMHGRRSRIAMRLAAEKTVQDRSHQKRAERYAKVYEELLN